MTPFPSYESIPEISALPAENRYHAYKRAHQELRGASHEYRKTDAAYFWSILSLIAVGLIPVPFVFTNGLVNLFVSIWGIVAVIPILWLASKHQRFRIAEIDCYLKHKK